jgi:hypothetical protein
MVARIVTRLKSYTFQITSRFLTVATRSCYGVSNAVTVPGAGTVVLERGVEVITRSYCLRFRWNPLYLQDDACSSLNYLQGLQVILDLPYRSVPAGV